MVRRGRARALAPLVLVLLAVVVTTADARPSARSLSGGTLKLLGSGDVTNLDPVSDYSLPGNMLTRMFARQLLAYPDAADFAKASTVAADVAREIPTRANGGISHDGRTYTFHLRPGVRWDTTPARAVTAADFVRGFEMLCNPVSPAGAPGYYTSTIAGMASYCAGFQQVAPKVDAIAAYVRGHRLAGVVATDPTTIVFTLVRPASDFLEILAIAFGSARPVEYMRYLPDSAAWRQHTISDGPYRIARYRPTREIDLDRNPAWSASSDPLRRAHADHVQIVEGLTADSVQQQIDAGTADMEWDVTPPPQLLPGLVARKDARLLIAPQGADDVDIYYLALNQYAGPMRQKLVREAVATAIDKRALVRLLGGPHVYTPANEVLLPGSAGSSSAYNAFPANDGGGNPAAARKLLRQAGYTSGPTIKLLYATVDPLPKLAQAMQSSLDAAGFRTRLVAATATDYFGKDLNTPDVAKRDLWDLTSVVWEPDWFGNDGRSLLEPLFTNPGPNSPDYGGYRSVAVEQLIARALAARGSAGAVAAWRTANARIVADIPVVPIAFGKFSSFHAARVHGCHALATSLNCDPTNVSLG
jgi:ABC-type transport system substrate-binding protein